MSAISILLLIASFVQVTFGQACGIYRIQYTGEITSQSSAVKTIKLPSTLFLHNLESKNSKLAFIEFQVDNEKIDAHVKSHLTSHLYSDSQKLKAFYKSKQTSFPIILILEKNGNTLKKRIKINWDEIDITFVDDERFGNLIQLHLKKISLE